MENSKTKFSPILFSTPMVQALLDGRKTMTRRTKGLEKFNMSPDRFRYDGPDEQGNSYYMEHLDEKGKPTERYFEVVCPYEVGDVFWVRETFTIIKSLETGLSYVLPKASFESYKDKLIQGEKVKWKPSIFMPKEACRIFLKIKSIRVQRLCEISSKDAEREGVFYDTLFEQYNCYLCGKAGHIGAREICNDGFYMTAYLSFKSLWKSINGEESWNHNPFVFVYEFEQIEKPLNFIL